MKKTSKQTKMFQEAWVKAYALGELVLNFPDVNAMERARLKLYGAVKRIRAGTEEGSLELIAAVENVTLHVDKESFQITMTKLTNDEDLMNIAGQLGFDLGAVQTQAERAHKAEKGELSGIFDHLYAVQAETDAKKEGD